MNSDERIFDLTINHLILRRKDVVLLLYLSNTSESPGTKLDNEYF